MPRYSEEEREQVRSETRQRLLEAAALEFARHGYSKANIDDISKKAGFAKGTIYNYFPSKRQLMLELIEEMAQVHLEFIAERVYPEQAADRRLEKFFEAGFSYVEAYLTQGMVMINNLYGPDTDFKQALYAVYQPMFGLVSQDIIALGIGQGIFRKVEPIPTAGLVMNIYLGIASQVNEDGKLWIQSGLVADFVTHALRK
jgi:AcrR family transcriptional regulator